jgi:glycerophosphoryl diester phosphodiesterase
VIGHRGDSAAALENTLESCRRAAAAGVAMVEVDVQLSSDGELVVFHDHDLRRLAGDPGVVEDLPARELLGRPLSLRRGGRLLTGALPSLGELLQGLPPALPVNLELKRRAASRTAIVERLAELAPPGRQLLVSSFDWELLALARRRLPSLALAPLASRAASPLLAAAAELEAWGLCCATRVAAEVLAATPARPVLVYTVDRIRDARRWRELGASGWFTDRPARLLAALGH